jgi:hypothetical protein
MSPKRSLETSSQVSMRASGSGVTTTTGISARRNTPGRPSQRAGGTSAIMTSNRFSSFSNSSREASSPASCGACSMTNFSISVLCRTRRSLLSSFHPRVPERDAREPQLSEKSRRAVRLPIWA